MLYAKTMNPEFFDYRAYESDIDGSIIIDGGRRFCGVNDGILADIRRLIDGYMGYEYECCYGGSIVEWLRGEFPRKANGRSLSPSEVGRIKRSLDRGDDEETLLECLSIAMCRRYLRRTIRGCSQGDWAEMYAPEDEGEPYLSYIEAVYFNTGTEVMVDEGIGEVAGPGDIMGSCFYTTAWNEEDIKGEVADMCGVPKDEVVLFVFDGYRRVAEYRRV